MTDVPERLPPELRTALAVLERHRVPGPEDASDWARAALVLLAHGRPRLLEAALPVGWCEGFWPEVLRATAALAAGRDPPTPLDWGAPPERRRKAT